MKGIMKNSRILLLMGVIVAGLIVAGFVLRGTALAQSTSASTAQGLINRVNAIIPREQALGRDTTQLEAAVADLQEIVNNTDNKGSDVTEGNGKRNSPLAACRRDKHFYTMNSTSGANQPLISANPVQIGMLHQ